MAGSVTPDVFENQALTLFRQLKAEGFEFQVAEPNILRVRPVGRVTPELRAELQRHKSHLLMLCDTGVWARHDVFTRQLDAAPSSVLVPRFVFRESQYSKGRCHACGEALECVRWGSCWRCMLARRLACRAPIPANLLAAHDEARICT